MNSSTIGINGWFLQHPYTGIGQYTIQLLKEFSKTNQRERFLVVVPNETCVYLMRQEQITLPVQVLRGVWLEDGQITLGGLRSGVQKHYWEQIQLPRFFQYEAFEKQGAQLVWHPYPAATWLRKPSYRTVVTVHDTIPWEMREYWQGPLSAAAHLMSKYAISKHADQIITVSQTSADAIVRVCHVPQERVRVIYNGVSETFWKSADPELIATVLQKHHLASGKYFLYVGGYDPRKRVEQLITSYRECQTMHPSPGESFYPLVLVGNPPESLTQALQPDTMKVITTGYLEESELNALYEASHAFVHFSKMEGFNIPVAQALVKHVPCAISDIPIHREIAGTAALYTDPDIAESTAALWRTLTTQPFAFPSPIDESTAARLRTFQWSTSAESHLQCFDAVIPDYVPPATA